MRREGQDSVGKQAGARLGEFLDWLGVGAVFLFFFAFIGISTLCLRITVSYGNHSP